MTALGDLTPHDKGLDRKKVFKAYASPEGLRK